MEIVLKETQLQVLAQINQTKQALQAEFQKQLQRESEVVAIILEALGIAPVDGMSIKDGKLILPEKKVDIDAAIEELSKPKSRKK